MNDLDFKAIGLKIKERRKSLGITQESIANALDVNPSHISNSESFTHYTDQNRQSPAMQRRLFHFCRIYLQT